MDKSIIIEYFKNKSVFKFDVIEGLELKGLIDNVELVMVVKKEDNYLDSHINKPIASIVLKDKSTFIKYVKYTQFYELNKLPKLKFLNAFREYCKINGLINTHYSDDMLVTVSNLQQQFQGLMIEKNMHLIKEIIDEVIGRSDYQLKADDTPLIKIVFNEKYNPLPNIEHLIKENINNLLKKELLKYTDVFDDILTVEFDIESKE